MTYRSTRPSHGKMNPTEVEALPPDELPKVNPGSANRWDKMVAAHKGGGRKNKMTTLGISKELIDTGDPEYLRCIRSAKNWVNNRRKEYYVNFGYVSSGVSSLLASAGIHMATSRYLSAQVSCLEGKAQSETIKTMVATSNAARLSEMTAWELCKRESEVAKVASNATGMPWMQEAVKNTPKLPQSTYKPIPPNRPEIVEPWVDTTEKNDDT